MFQNLSAGKAEIISLNQETTHLLQECVRLNHRIVEFNDEVLKTIKRSSMVVDNSIAPEDDPPPSGGPICLNLEPGDKLVCLESDVDALFVSRHFLRLTAFVEPSPRTLRYAICGFDENFVGSVLACEELEIVGNSEEFLFNFCEFLSQRRWLVRSEIQYQKYITPLLIDGNWGAMYPTVKKVASRIENAWPAHPRNNHPEISEETWLKDGHFIYDINHWLAASNYLCHKHSKFATCIAGCHAAVQMELNGG